MLPCMRLGACWVSCVIQPESIGLAQKAHSGRFNPPNQLPRQPVDQLLAHWLSCGQAASVPGAPCCQDVPRELHFDKLLHAATSILDVGSAALQAKRWAPQDWLRPSLRRNTCPPCLTFC